MDKTLLRMLTTEVGQALGIVQSALQIIEQDYEMLDDVPKELQPVYNKLGNIFEDLLETRIQLQSLRKEIEE